jgi:hypothetical protein
MAPFSAHIDHEKPRFSGHFRSGRGPIREFFLVLHHFAGIPGGFGTISENHPAPITPKNRRNIHWFILFRREPIMAAYDIDRRFE